MSLLNERFVLEREIGSGGMAGVFLSHDEKLNRPVAVKVLKEGFGGTDLGERFRREGRTAARLSHPNIVQVYDAGEAELDGRVASYLVMEHVSGGDLKDLIEKEGSVSTERLARLGEEVSDGLSHAHEQGVIHRDIKPHNILLDSYGGAKLADFGIARALDATSFTQSGAYLGTALYSSPEQLQGEEVTPKSDVYSLGATLYEAATGGPPFAGSPLEVASQHVSKEPEPPDTGNGELDALILDCLEKKPDHRPTAGEVRERLSGMTHTSEAGKAGAYATPPTVAETRQTQQQSAADSPGERPRRRRRMLRAMTAVLLVAVLGSGAVFAFLNGGGAQETGQSSGSQDASQGQAAPAETTSRETSPRAGGASTPESTQPEEESPPPAGSSGGEGEETTPAAAPAAAARTVEEHYRVAASEDYREAWGFLASRYQRELGSRAAWTEQFRTLERVEFTEGPAVVRSSGNTATVSFSTVAHHESRTDRRSGTATLVREGGGWKIRSLSL